HIVLFSLVFFFFQAEDGIRDFHVTGVQTCALPISTHAASSCRSVTVPNAGCSPVNDSCSSSRLQVRSSETLAARNAAKSASSSEIGRASCRERVEIWVGAVSRKKTETECSRGGKTT